MAARSRRTLAGTVFLLVFGLIFAGVGYAVTFKWGKPLLDRAEESRTWPSVTGTIEQSEIAQGRDSDGDRTYRPDIVYRYEIDGRTMRSGDVYVGGAASTSAKSDAFQIVNRYPVGQQVEVYYDPAAPGKAVLIPGEAPGGKIAFWVGVIFLAVGLVIVIGPLLKLAFVVLAVGAAAARS
jgi:hypothetical protein